MPLFCFLCVVSFISLLLHDFCCGAFPLQCFFCILRHETRRVCRKMQKLGVLVKVCAAGGTGTARIEQSNGGFVPLMA
ncbi:hypothetical protein BMAGN_3000 [Bifidobacterium magnum]|uniref:Secreted protein n=1 Tax=Bifidobacterium magnum TaxID=1692 RepID=A0A087B9U8_9BIFI|nr:hypothetical protein BMAGN_3000 [Bifidobacterium magnum]